MAAQLGCWRITAGTVLAKTLCNLVLRRRP